MDNPSKETGMKIFEKTITVDGIRRMKLTRKVSEDDREEIVGIVPPTWLFGDWRHDAPNFGTNPEPAQIAADVGKELGSEIIIAAVVYETDGTITLQFTRKSDGAEAVPANGEPKPAAAETKENRLPPAPSHQKSPEEVFTKRMQSLEEECAEAEREYLHLKEQTKESKEIYEGKISEMRRYIRKFSEPAPLFDKAKNGTANGHADVVKEPTDDSWKKMPLTELGLSETVLKKLDAAELTTVGQLQAFVEKTGLAGFTDPIAEIKGIGAATAEKITAALDKFWTARGMGAKEAAAAPPAPVIEKDIDLGAKKCRTCGCTDDNCSQCVEKTGMPCHWVEDDLCSACATPAAESTAGFLGRQGGPAPAKAKGKPAKGRSIG